MFKSCKSHYNKYNFNFNNLGMVAAAEAGKRAQEQGWNFFQFGIGINRTNNFNNRIFIP